MAVMAVCLRDLALSVMPRPRAEASDACCPNWSSHPAEMLTTCTSYGKGKGHIACPHRAPRAKGAVGT